MNGEELLQWSGEPVGVVGVEVDDLGRRRRLSDAGDYLAIKQLAFRASRFRSCIALTIECR